MKKRNAMQMILDAAKASCAMCYEDSSYRVYVRDAVK